MPSSSKVDLQSLIDPLVRTARKAGSEVMEVHQMGAQAVSKPDGSPVTEADRRAEAIVLSGLDQAAPGIPVVSEENPSSHDMTVGELFFLVDPLDGTKEFLKGNGAGAFTINIALIERGEPVLGVVFAPALGRMFWGAKNVGSFEEGKPIQVRPLPNDGAQALVSVSHMEERTSCWLTEHAICKTIPIGSSLKFCLLANGEADVYPRFGPTMEWDTAAGDAILRAAGGNMRTVPDGEFVYGKAGFRNGPFLASGNWREL